MGQVVLILGNSGNGKSASLRNMKRDKCMVFNTAGKLLPFKNDLNCINLRSLSTYERYQYIEGGIRKYQDQIKSFIVDDAQFLMAFELLDRANERGYDKFTEIAKRWIDLMDSIGKADDDVIVYFLMHTEYDNTNQSYKSKTVGKMVDQYVSPESLATIVLGAHCKDGRYFFTTHNGGNDTVKSPIGMFEEDEIDNDLKLVDTTIRDYYGFGKETKNESV